MRTAVDTMDTENLGATTRAGLTMRAYGIGRTLRRARDCDWVQNTDEGNLDEARALVTRLLELNPCADQAQAAMTAAQHAESEEERAQAMQDAMEILSSDTCSATSNSGQAPEEDVEEDHIAEAETQVQDGIEDLME